MLCLILMNDAFNSFMFTSYTSIYIHICSIGLFLRKFQAWSIVFYNVNAILSKLHIICFYRKHIRKLVGKSRIFIGNSNTTNSLFTRSASLLHMAWLATSSFWIDRHSYWRGVTFRNSMLFRMRSGLSRHQCILT